MKKEIESLTFKELVAYSVVAESVSRKAYLDFSEAAVGELQKERFKSLAKDEGMHKRELEKIYKKEFGDEDIEYPKGKELPPHEEEIDVRNSENLVKSLESARKNEMNAYEIYKYLAKEKPMYKEIFEYLAVMEWGHYESLKSEIELYKGVLEERKDTNNLDPSEIWREYTGKV
ncbi:MAG: ferritin family protein [Thermoplasmata archaeon]